MIKANELRIGNWVLLENDGKWTPIQVTGVCLASDEKKIDINKLQDEKDDNFRK